MTFRVILRARRKECAVPIYIVKPFVGARHPKWEHMGGFDARQLAFKAWDLHSFQAARSFHREAIA